MESLKFEWPFNSSRSKKRVSKNGCSAIQGQANCPSFAPVLLDMCFFCQSFTKISFYLAVQQFVNITVYSEYVLFKNKYKVLS